MIKICKIWDAGLFGTSPQVRFFKRVQISLQYISCSTMKYRNVRSADQLFFFLPENKKARKPAASGTFLLEISKSPQPYKI
jgi:hypothetical protein